MRFYSRSRRLSFVAGSVAVVVLAIAGFAAFAPSQPSEDQSIVEAAAASIGHTAGAYAGLAFTRIGADGDSAVIVATAVEPTDGTEELTPSESSSPSTSEATGTIASPESGWLSEVEVRALVTKYFEPADVNRAVRIAWCESRFDPNAVDLRTGGVGLFNHLPRYWADRSANAGFAGADATDAEASTAAAAWEVYQGGGWDVFTCR